MAGLDGTRATPRCRHPDDEEPKHKCALHLTNREIKGRARKVRFPSGENEEVLPFLQTIVNDN